VELASASTPHLQMPSSSSSSSNSSSPPGNSRKLQDSLNSEARKTLKRLSEEGRNGMTSSGKKGYPEAMFVLAGYYGSGSIGIALILRPRSNDQSSESIQSISSGE
jgi:hypothetical protein